MAQRRYVDEGGGDNEDGAALLAPPRSANWMLHRRTSSVRPRRGLFVVLLGIVVVAFSLRWAFKPPTKKEESCDKIHEGYQCTPEVSHYWGPYTPFFSVMTGIVDSLPQECEITFAQILSRHGARYPTQSKTDAYRETVKHLHETVERFDGKYAFLKEYKYTLGAEDLTFFGRNQLTNSGIKFYSRYPTLSKRHTPFVRAGDQWRVVESAQNFTWGFHSAKVAEGNSSDIFPIKILEISEAPGSNNTLNHGLCTKYEERSPNPSPSMWAKSFVPPIRDRLNRHLEGADLTLQQTIDLMELCPYETVASDTGEISDFCQLFSHDEWRQYNYYDSLEKFYNYGNGHPLGPTQGVGFANELIARMTDSPVKDDTSTNHTLDDDPKTFPLGYPLYADFSHDNDLMGHFTALGLYNDTSPLSNTTLQGPEQTDGFSASWVVPFASRAYFEKMKCKGEDEELVRILVNDRVIPLKNCGADELGRCKLSAWVHSLSFVRGNGHWDRCFD